MSSSKLYQQNWIYAFQRSFTKYVALLVVFVSVLVMVGWFAKNSSVVQIHPSFAPMQFSTALSFFMVALGVLSFPKYPKLGIISAFGVLFMAFMSFYGYAIKEVIWLDTFFVKPFTATETAYPGRMAVNTAFAFSLCGFSLLLTLKKKKTFGPIGGYLGLVVFGLGLTALIAYGLELENVYKWGKLTGMALHTCSCFILLGLALIFLNLLKLSEFHRGKQKARYLFGFVFTLQFILLLIDIIIPRGVALGIVQVIGIVLVTFTNSRRFLLLSFIGSMVFTVLGFLFSRDGADLWMVYSDRILSLVVCALVYILCLDILRKSEHLKKQNKNLDKTVAERTKELSARNKDLEQFAYICTHDLQEPLRTISSYSKMVSETNRENLDDLGKRSVDYIQGATERMQRLIKALLDYARLGKNLSLEFVHTEKVVRSIMVDLNAIIQEKEAKVTLHHLPQIECYKNEFHLLVKNLLVNALIYDKEGIQPEIEIGYKNETNRHLFYVKDNGLGIEKNFQSRIFKLFQRLHSETEISGTGLGLSQCKKIAELHGGDIWVDSKPGKGSTFYFTISKTLKTHIDYDQENSPY